MMSPIDPQLRIRSVELGVSDLERSAAFYERVLGLPLIERHDGEALLGVEGRTPALTLTQIVDPQPLTPASTGLYHVAWLHPSRAALAESVRRVARGGWPLEGASDHGVSEALYLSDPDGLGIELYADRPRERWQRPPDGRGVVMVTLPLDLEDLLAQAHDSEAPAMAPGSAIGHVHLKASDAARTSAFYRDTLGFEEQARLPSASFLAAGGYHHHVGLNSWQSAGAGPVAEGVPALRRVDFELGGAAALEDLSGRLAQAGVEPEHDEQALLLRDPDGELLAFRAA